MADLVSRLKAVGREREELAAALKQATAATDAFSTMTEDDLQQALAEAMAPIHEDPAAARQVLRKLLGGGAITVTPDADGWAYSGDLGLDCVVLRGCTNPPSQWAGRG